MRRRLLTCSVLLILIASTHGEADPGPDPAPEPNPEPVADPDAEAVPDADPDAQGYMGMANRPAYNQGCGLMDNCCGMYNEGCCVGGQQCYTYYENVCENINVPQCNMRGKEFCEPVILPDCRIVRERGVLQVEEERCKQIPSRQCMVYQRTVCNWGQESQDQPVTWLNEKLVAAQSNNKSKCEIVKQCNYTTEVIPEERQVPKRVCDNDIKYQTSCRDIPKTEYKFEIRTDYVTQYVKDCRTISQPACSVNACMMTGCTNGGRVCSQNEYNRTMMCLPGGNNCQEMARPLCYSQANSCNYATQQCCLENPQVVCQRVPRVIPVQRNVSIPITRMEQQCSQVEVSVPKCRTEYAMQIFNRTVKHCQEVEVKTCFNYAIPQYDVKTENKTEKVPFSVRKCNKYTDQVKFCHTFPRANVTCWKGRANRPYALNKVVCDRQVSVNMCKVIPESECKNVQNQRCRVVPRQVCQPTCSTSNLCNQCDTFRSRGGFSVCNSGTCPNFYPADSYVNYTSGYNPGYVWGEGYNPGYGGGEGAYNPGYVGGDGYNPGYVGDDGYNPGYGGGDDGFNPGYVDGGNGFNPGYVDGGDGFNPGYVDGGDGFNPGYVDGGDGFNPGYVDGGDGFNPGYVDGGDGFNPGYVDGGDGYNPGYVGGGDGFNPGYVDGGNGYNPGYVNGADGYNPGYVGGGFNPGRPSNYNPGMVDDGSGTYSSNGKLYLSGLDGQP